MMKKNRGQKSRWTVPLTPNIAVLPRFSFSKLKEAVQSRFTSSGLEGFLHILDKLTFFVITTLPKFVFIITRLLEPN